jgi:type I restriction enzyme S subunit
VARLESGHTPSRSRPDYWNGGIPWISLQDTDGLEELEISETRETVSELGIQNSSARILPKGTVVFLRTASVGLCSIMGRDMATSQHFANWVCGPKLDPHYLVQVFRHMRREWRRLQAGSVLPDVYMPVFEKLQILLPPREEQAAIAAVGEAFDRRIAAERAYLEHLQETKRGLAQALLSGRVRVPPQALRREEA